VNDENFLKTKQNGIQQKEKVYFRNTKKRIKKQNKINNRFVCKISDSFNLILFRLVF
jgi:hypothetical protein